MAIVYMKQLPTEICDGFSYVIAEKQQMFCFMGLYQCRCQETATVHVDWAYPYIHMLHVISVKAGVPLISWTLAHCQPTGCMVML